MLRGAIRGLERTRVPALTPTPSDEAEIIAQMEKLGEAQVRLLVNSGQWPTHLNRTALKWLSEKDRVSAQKRLETEGKQTELAASANDAAWTSAKAAERAAAAAEAQAAEARLANTRATLALIIAAVSLAVSAAIGIWHR